MILYIIVSEVGIFLLYDATNLERVLYIIYICMYNILSIVRENVLAYVTLLQSTSLVA